LPEPILLPEAGEIYEAGKIWAEIQPLTLDRKRNIIPHMAAELAPELRAKYPNLEVLIGCGATAWCSKTDADCVQMERWTVKSHLEGSDWVVDTLPEVPNATGCADCLINVGQKS
jgi:hypothetical protein